MAELLAAVERRAVVVGAAVAELLAAVERRAVVVGAAVAELLGVAVELVAAREPSRPLGVAVEVVGAVADVCARERHHALGCLLECFDLACLGGGRIRRR